MLEMLEHVSRCLNWASGGVWPESVCCRVWRAHLCGDRRATLAARVLDVLESNHCKRSFHYHRKRAIRTKLSNKIISLPH